MNFYFRFPILLDILFAAIIVGAINIILECSSYSAPEWSQILSLTSDIANISLTSAGFVLTLLTVLITFKGSSKVSLESKSQDHNLFDLFFATPLYDQTIQLLKYCVISLLMISLVGYSFKLTVSGDGFNLLFYFNAGSLVILFLTLWRCLFVLNKIIKFQSEKN